MFRDPLSRAGFAIGLGLVISTKLMGVTQENSFSSPVKDGVHCQKKVHHQFKERDLSDPIFLRIADLPLSELKKIASSEENRTLSAIPASSVTSESVLKVNSLTASEHIAAVLMLAFGIPNCVFTVPATTFFIGKFLIGNISLAFQVLLGIILPLSIFSIEFIPSRLQSWPAWVLFRYFSMSMIMEERPPTYCQTGNESLAPTLVAAYPHGVFPYGSMLTVMSWPLLVGHHMRPLAANAALRTPIIRQWLQSLATVNASRASAHQALNEWPFTVGLSPGGVAEVFLVNDPGFSILLKERLGFIKLAIRTGSDIIPAYMFGTEELYGVWMGEGIPGVQQVLRYVSRKVVGFATVFPWGRWLLPIPHRTPLLTVLGKRIQTSHIKCEEPSLEQMLGIREQFQAEIVNIFERYKHLYNIQDEILVIK